MGSHRVILLNFTLKEAQIVAKAGYNVERGIVGTPDHELTYCPFQSPHPLYEYDVLFYNTDFSSELSAELTDPKNLIDERGSFSALKESKSPPQVRVSFIGKPNGMQNLVLGGLGFAALLDADPNVSSLLEIEPLGLFKSEKLHRLIAGFKSQTSGIGQFFEVRDGPFYHFAVLTSRSRSQVAGYGTIYDGRVVPKYVILPQLRNIPQATIQLLGCFESVVPGLFPDRSRRDWLQSDEYLLPDEKKIHQEINEIITIAVAATDTARKKLDEASRESRFIRDLLVATEDNKVAPEMRLSGIVKRALEFVEFEVRDIDAVTKNAIKKEDFWVIDGDFLAITEVTGTVNKNPEIKEFNDILGRLATIFKRQTDLSLPSGANVSGLLVLNFDIDTLPAKRPRAYSSDDEHIIETAAEQGIGILSTVELHRIVVAVKEGSLSKEEGRAILKRPGRIEYVTS